MALGQRRRILPREGADRKPRADPTPSGAPSAAGIRCAECGRAVNELTSITERWRHWSDGVGELHPFCPECAAREFGYRSA